MVDLHLMALTEPLYLFLSLSALFLLLRYSSDLKLRWLVFAGAASALAFLTRYAGAALVATGFLTLLFLHRKKPAFAIRYALSYVLVSCLPMAAWLFRNFLLSGSASDYSTGKAFGPLITFGAIVFGLNTMSTWMLPGFVPELLRIAAMMALALSLSAACFYGRFRGMHTTGLSHWLNSEDAKLPILSCLFIVCNLLLLSVIVSFVDETILPDDRILLPLFGPAVLLLLWSLQTTSSIPVVRKAVWLLTILIIGLISVTNSVRSATHLFAAARSGCGYRAKQWRNSSLIRQLQSMPTEIPIYTTLPSCIRFLTGRPARLLPTTYNLGTEQQNKDYSREISKMRSESNQSGIVLVYFRGSVHRPFPSEAEIKQVMDLHLVARDDTGSLYMSHSLLNQAVATLTK